MGNFWESNEKAVRDSWESNEKVMVKSRESQNKVTRTYENVWTAKIK